MNGFRHELPVSKGIARLVWKIKQHVVASSSSMVQCTWQLLHCILQPAADLLASADGLRSPLIVMVTQQQTSAVATDLWQAAMWCSSYLIGANELRELILQAAVNASQPLAVKCALGCVKQASSTGIPSLQANATCILLCNFVTLFTCYYHTHSFQSCLQSFTQSHDIHLSSRVALPLNRHVC